MSTVLVCLSQTTSSDPCDWQNTWIWVPQGYGRILSGKMKKGDRWLNRRVLRDRREEAKGLPPGGLLWNPWRGLKGGINRLYHLVRTHTCVIRPGVASEKPCERCGTQERVKGERYCLYCGHLICEAGRRGR